MSNETSLLSLVEVSRRLREVQSRKLKIEILSDFLRRIPEKDIEDVISFLAGKPLKRPLNIGGSALRSALTVPPAKKSTLKVREVRRYFVEIGERSGPGSVGARVLLLSNLFRRATNEEREFLVGVITGELRQGAALGILKEAIGVAFGIPKTTIDQAYMLKADIGLLAKEAKEGKLRVSFNLFTPIAPMLASTAELEEVPEIHGEFSAEFKVDGARIQVHRGGAEVRIFSRHLKDVTASLPEIVEMARSMKETEFVIEGEVFATDERGRPLPFQVFMRRFGRRKDVEKKRELIPISVYFFDCLFLDGEPLFDLPHIERWERLSKILDISYLIPRIERPKTDELQEFLEKALEEGHEGLMVKDLRSPYVAGVRGKHWLKVKPAKTLDLVIIAAEWGHGRRRGWLSNYLLAVRDPETGEFLPIGKTFKGLKDEEFQWMTDELLKLKQFEDRYTVFVKPKIVVEVAFNEIQKSPHYSSGFALRFARIKRIRKDKKPEECDTIDLLRKLYEDQFRYKGKLEEGLF
jgi:DNA ligase-1